jgi:hypothetical protein
MKQTEVKYTTLGTNVRKSMKQPYLAEKEDGLPFSVIAVHYDWRRTPSLLTKGKTKTDTRRNREIAFAPKGSKMHACKRCTPMRYTPTRKACERDTFIRIHVPEMHKSIQKIVPRSSSEFMA